MVMVFATVVYEFVLVSNRCRDISIQLLFILDALNNNIIMYKFISGVTVQYTLRHIIKSIVIW